MLYYIQAFVKALLKYNTQQRTGRIAHATGSLSFAVLFQHLAYNFRLTVSVHDILSYGFLEPCSVHQLSQPSAYAASLHLREKKHTP